MLVLPVPEYLLAVQPDGIEVEALKSSEIDTCEYVFSVNKTNQ